MPTHTIRIWDLPTRLFHWLLAASFLGAFVTAESERWRLVHVTLGYTVGGLVLFRLLWVTFAFLVFAAAMGWDEVEFRLKNALKVGDPVPITGAVGEGEHEGSLQIIKSTGLVQCIEQGAAAEERE